MRKKKKINTRYKVGFYLMDPYTQEKQYDVKGLNIVDAEREFKKAMNKYR